MALDFFPKLPRVQSDPTKVPMEVPTVPGGLDELQASLGNILKKIDALPLQRLGADTDATLVSLRQTLDSARGLVERLDREVTPEMRTTLVEARRALGAVDQSLGADAPLEQDLQQTLKQLSRAADALRSLADYLERHPESLLRGKPRDGS